MGGHSAWRKRVAAGEPAKGRGGAICRHRPHLGRKGEDLKLNRKGNIAGGNPKKLKSNKSRKEEGNDGLQVLRGHSADSGLRTIFAASGVTIMVVSFSAVTYWLIFR
jgi:hypothetical protein